MRPAGRRPSRRVGSRRSRAGGRCPWRSIGQGSSRVRRNSSGARRRSSTVARVRTRGGFSLRVPMKRSGRSRCPPARGGGPARTWRRGPGERALDVVGRALRAVVVADPEAPGGALGDGADALEDALPDRLERLVACAAPRGVDACALGRAVVEGEDGEPSALGGEGGRPAGAPHGVDPARGRSGRRGGLDREAGPPGSPPTGRCRAARRIGHPSRGRMSRRARRTRSLEGRRPRWRRRARTSRSARLRGPTGATVAPRPSARGGCRRAPAGPPRPGLRPASGPQVPSGIGPAGPGRCRGGAGASAAWRSRWTPERATPQTP